MIALHDQLVLEPICIPAWTWVVVALAVLAVYAMTLENGAVLAHGATQLHELFHDARHFIGVPCH